MQGKKGKYAFEAEENENRLVTVINTETGEVQQAEEYKEGRYKIRENGQIKYFSLAMILAFFQRQQIERFSQEAFKRRNNVEASIFQQSSFTRKNKTRYRGKIKHQWWAYNRCMWVNLVRIRNWMGEVCPDGAKMRAIQVNLQIVRVFIKMREMLSTHADILRKLEQIEKKDIEQDLKIMLIFEYLKQLEQAKQAELEKSPRKVIKGYRKDNR